MAGQKFQYDESGSTFFYFILSFLALILIPATIYFWPKKKEIGKKKNNSKLHRKFIINFMCSVNREGISRMKELVKWWNAIETKNFWLFSLIFHREISRKTRHCSTYLLQPKKHSQR